MLQNHPVLHMENLTRSYGKHPALSGLSADLELECGRVYGLIGPNGSGKTTLLKLLSGILSPSSGHISLTGESGAFPSAELLPFLNGDRIFSVTPPPFPVKNFWADGWKAFLWGRKRRPPCCAGSAAARG